MFAATPLFDILKQVNRSLSDPVILFVLESAKRFGFVHKIWLFGSSVTGNQKITSDYDLAFELLDSQDEWGEFAEILREKNPSLNTLDLVRLDQIGDGLRTKVLQEGEIIYDKSTTEL